MAGAIRGCRNRSRSSAVHRAVLRPAQMPPDSWTQIWLRAYEPATNFATSSQAATISALRRSTKWRRHLKLTGGLAAAHFSATRMAGCTGRIVKERWAAELTRTLSEAGDSGNA